MTRVGTLGVLVALLWALPARADGPDAKLESAKTLFREGVQQFEAGNVAGALDDFLRSRAAFPSSQNTLNVAICLDRLDRPDEALRSYDDLIAEFYAELSEVERESVRTAVANLRKRVAYVDVTSNVRGELTIDGAARGSLPLALPLRVRSGPHRVRVAKDGYSAFGGTFEAATGETAHVEARLEPLGNVGEVRVEDSGSAKATVFVDGRRVGSTPWEGLLSPGRHVLWTRASTHLGSIPTPFTVVGGQTAIVHVQSEKLGAELVITPDPATAQVAVDGVPLGAGRAIVNLPEGPHAIDVDAAGYLPARRMFVVPAFGLEELEVQLKADPATPHIPHARDERQAHFFLSALLAYPAITGSPTGCNPSCNANDHFRILVALRAGLIYRGVGYEGEFGYLTYGLGDMSRYSAVYGTGGVSYRMPVTGAFAVVPRVGIGVSDILVVSSPISINGDKLGVYGRVGLGLEMTVGDALVGVDLGLVTLGSVSFYELPITFTYAF